MSVKREDIAKLDINELEKRIMELTKLRSAAQDTDTWISYAIQLRKYKSFYFIARRNQDHLSKYKKIHAARTARLDRGVSYE